MRDFGACEAEKGVAQELAVLQVGDLADAAGVADDAVGFGETNGFELREHVARVFKVFEKLAQNESVFHGLRAALALSLIHI